MLNSSRRKTILGFKEMDIKLVTVYIVLLVSGVILCSFIFFTIIPAGTEDLTLSWQMFLWPLIYANIFTGLLVSVLAIFLSAMLNRRIVGPLYRFTKTLEQIGSGDLTVDTRLRAGDELKPFAASLDAAVVALRTKINTLKDSFTRLEVQMGENAPPDLQRVASDVRAQLNIFRS